MKVIRYCILVTLVGSSLVCWGSHNAPNMSSTSPMKHASLALGKFSLALVCAHVGFSTLFHQDINNNRNSMLFDLRLCKRNLQNKGIFKFLSYKNLKIDYWLDTALSKLCLVGVSSLATYTLVKSGSKSLKKARKAWRIKTTTVIDEELSPEKETLEEAG